MNPWSNPDRLSAPDAATLAAFIDARSQSVDQATAHVALVDALDPRPGETLLDVGCGTGVIARRLIAHVQPGGTVLGIDISRAMLEFAQRQTMPAGLAYQQADASFFSNTLFSKIEGAFDGATAARLLMHVDEPARVLHQLRRALRPGGRLALLEADWGTLALDHGNRGLTRRILAWRTDTVDGNNWMGRQLVRRCLETGWTLQDVRVCVTVARDAEGTLLGSIRRCADLAAQNDVISNAERQAWLEELDQRLAQGHFFATMNEYIVVARR